MIRVAGPAAEVDVDLDHGARLAALSVRGHDLLVGRADDPLAWGCYPMAPFAGRIRGGRFRWKRRLVELERNAGVHAIHGTVLDRPWTLEHHEDDYLRARCDLQPGWPEAGSAVHEVAVRAEGLELRLEVHSTEMSFPATCGWHPWFRRRLEPGGADLRVEVQSGRWYPRAGDGLPIGSLETPPATPPDGGPFDDCFTALRWPVRVTWPDVLALELTATCDHVVVFDELDHAVCVEPQTGPPDAHNLGLATVVTPEQPLVLEAALRWTEPPPAGGH